MILKNVSIFFGEELEYIPSTKIKITSHKFEKIQKNIFQKNIDKVIDCEGLLLIPGLVNCHTHIGDSVGKDVILNGTVDKKIHPVVGAKSKILKKTKPMHLITFMRNTCLSMIKKGITTFVDFREGGLEGINHLKKALSNIPIRCIVLGRIEFYQNSNQIMKNSPIPKEKQAELSILLKKCDGIGISGANENSDFALKLYSKIKKIRAIHSAETKESVSFSKKITNKSEVKRALQLRPHFLVHMTHASKRELIEVGRKTRGIVVCPRSNATLAEGFPDVNLMQKAGCTVGVGTDNVMVNSPDLFREMDFLWNASQAINKVPISPKSIMKMTTVNAAKILEKNIGKIQEGMLADGIFIEKHSIDLEPMHNPHASVIHRVSESSIRAVMIGGKIAYGKI